MSLFAIGDLHLSLSTNKPMDVFGGRWENYVEKIKSGFSQLTDDDITVLCGDISWGMDLADCLADFLFIEALPGKKIILKGNHDYWWTTLTKANRFFADHSIDSLSLLHNNCHMLGDVAICGTRGWFFEEETGTEQDKKVRNRELMRLAASLKAADKAGAREKLCFFHYPPRYRDYVCEETVNIMSTYNVRHCFYGHIHGATGHRLAVQGDVDGIMYTMISADYLEFTPRLIDLL